MVASVYQTPLTDNNGALQSSFRKILKNFALVQVNDEILDKSEPNSENPANVKESIFSLISLPIQMERSFVQRQIRQLFTNSINSRKHALRTISEKAVKAANLAQTQKKHAQQYHQSYVSVFFHSINCVIKYRLN